MPGVGRVWVSDSRLMRTGGSFGSGGAGVYMANSLNQGHSGMVRRTRPETRDSGFASSTHPGMTSSRQRYYAYKKAPAKPGPSISAHAADQISANRIRRSDAAPSSPGKAHRTERGRGRTSPSSWNDRLRGSRARRARQAGSLPEPR